jgi:hypothetical protein
MEIQFELPVAVRGRPMTYKTDRLVLATVPVTVDVYECSPSDLTPAVTVGFELNDAPRLEYHAHQGRLYIPLWPVSGLLQSVPLFGSKNVQFQFKHTSHLVEKALETDAMQGRPTVFPHEHLTMIKRSQAVKPMPLSDLAFETLDLQAVAEQVAAFENRMSRLLCVEGMVYVQVAEPCITVSRSATNRFAYLVRPAHQPFRSFNWERKRFDAVFRIDDSEKASEFCRAAQADRDPLLNFHKFGLEIHDSTVLAMQSERASSYVAARNLIRSIGGMHEIDSHQRSGEIRELSSLVSRHHIVSCPDELCDLFAKLVDIDQAGTAVFSANDEKEIAKQVAVMWDNRQVTFSEPNFSYNNGATL